jgi:hypothetical protein
VRGDRGPRPVGRSGDTRRDRRGRSRDRPRSERGMAEARTFGISRHPERRMRWPLRCAR